MENNRRAMYGISRIDDDRHHTHAWRVSLRRQGKALVGNFPDRKFGGSGAALDAAQSYRDELLKNYPPLTRQEFARIRRRNNTSGVTGVFRYSKKYQLANGTIRESWYWGAQWPTDSGEFKSVNYAVKQYGEEMARRLAIEARRAGLERVEGVFWSCERALPGSEGLPTGA